MEIIKEILIALLVISLAIAIAYVIYMGTKKKQFPQVDFSRFKNGKNDVDAIEHLVNSAIKGVNGWMWLATVFMVIYYFMTFWSISFMVLNIVIAAYDAGKYKDIILFLVCGSLLFSCLDLWIGSKEKSMQFHKQWFDTSITTKEYIVKFSAAETFEKLCEIVTEFNNRIYSQNNNVHFL